MLIKAARDRAYQLALTEFQTLFGVLPPPGWGEAWLEDFSVTSLQEMEARELAQKDAARPARERPGIRTQMKEFLPKPLPSGLRASRRAEFKPLLPHLSPTARALAEHLERWPDDVRFSLSAHKRDPEAEQLVDVTDLLPYVIVNFQFLPQRGKAGTVFVALKDRELAVISLVIDRNSLMVPTETPTASGSELLDAHRRRLRRSRQTAGACWRERSMSRSVEPTFTGVPWPAGIRR